MLRTIEVGTYLSTRTAHTNPSLDGYHDHLKNLYDAPLAVPRGEIRITKETNPNTVVLIPVHDDRRMEAITVALSGLGRQTDRDSLQLVIADNGMSTIGIEQIRTAATENNLNVTFVDARPTEEKHKAPAHARNVALAQIHALAKNDQAYRGPVLLLDSDCAPGSEDTIRRLRHTLARHDNIVAVAADTIPVEKLNKETYDDYLKTPTTEGTVRVLPSLWTPTGKVRIGDIVAYSSQVAGKTTGLIIDQHKVWNIIDYAGGLYVAMPNRSAEDMIAAAALTRPTKGTHRILSDSGAKILDEARQTPQQLQNQQIRWGRDHVILTKDLREMGLAESGIHILEPYDDTWLEWTVPNTDHITGYLINPKELLETSYQLESLLTSSELFTDRDDRTKITSGIRVLRRIIQAVEERRKEAAINFRPDLPSPKTPDPQNSRHSIVATTSRLTGNILGLYDIYPQASNFEATCPNIFMFGLRQSGKWNN